MNALVVREDERNLRLNFGDAATQNDKSLRDEGTEPDDAVSAPFVKAKHKRNFICKQSILLVKPSPDFPTRFVGLKLSLQCPPLHVMGQLIQWPGIDFEWIPHSFLAYNATLGCVYYAGFRLKNNVRNIPNQQPPDEFVMGDFITIRNNYLVAEAQIVGCYQATNQRIFWKANDDGSMSNLQEKGEYSINYL